MRYGMNVFNNELWQLKLCVYPGYIKSGKIVPIRPDSQCGIRILSSADRSSGVYKMADPYVGLDMYSIYGTRPQHRNSDWSSSVKNIVALEDARMDLRTVREHVYCVVQYGFFPKAYHTHICNTRGR